MREQLRQIENKVPKQGIDWIILEENLLPQKGSLFWNLFGGNMLCQGWGKWKDIIMDTHD